MKFNTLPRRVAATGAVTALTAGALVSLTTTAAQADTVTQTYSCTANGVPLSVTLDTDIPQLALVAAGGPYPAGEAVAAGQVPDGVTNTFTITDDTKTLLDTAQTSKIDFTSFAGTSTIRSSTRRSNIWNIALRDAPRPARAQGARNHRAGRAAFLSYVTATSPAAGKEQEWLRRIPLSGRNRARCRSRAFRPGTAGAALRACPNR